jgi:hypothetical protein
MKVDVDMWRIDILCPPYLANTAVLDAHYIWLRT